MVINRYLTPTSTSHCVDLKRSIAAASYPDFEARATRLWHKIIQELNKVTEQYIHQINFNLLDGISQDEIDKIKRHGSALIRDIVDDAQVVGWCLMGLPPTPY
jgi:hypothetical protein